MRKFSSNYYFSGLSGLKVPIPQYRFPPPFENASRLTYYASLFNSIEINSSFYKLPQAATVTKWAASVNGKFNFTFKLWKEITHIKGLNFKKEDVASFLKTIDGVGNKQGCLLIQFPPSLGHEHIKQLQKLLRCMRDSNSPNWKIAIEFRNKSWYTASTYELLELFHAALVIQDIPKSATPRIEHASDFMYIRFHGPTGNYRDSYADSFLSEYATYIREWVEEGKQVYVYFNNTMGDAVKNLQTLNGFVNHNEIQHKAVKRKKKPAVHNLKA